MDYDPHGMKSWLTHIVLYLRLMDEVKLTAAFKSNIKTTTISDLPLIPKDMQNPITADWS